MKKSRKEHKVKRKNLLQFERPEILVDEQRSNRMCKDRAKHFQVLGFYPALKMAPPCHQVIFR